VADLFIPGCSSYLPDAPKATGIALSALHTTFPLTFLPACHALAGQNKHRCLVKHTLLLRRPPTLTAFYRGYLPVAILPASLVTEGQNRRNAPRLLLPPTTTIYV